MASNIDATKPPVGRGAKTEDIRANFLVAKNEITQLQDVAVPARAARAGDLGGTTASTTVTRIQGRNVSTAAPGTNQAYLWSGSQWTPGSVLQTSGGTLNGNLYLAAGTPTDPTQAISLGYLNTRINEFVTSGGTLPDAPTAPPGTYGRRNDHTWQPVVTPSYSGDLLFRDDLTSGRSRLIFGDSGQGLQLQHRPPPSGDTPGYIQIGGSNVISIGRGSSFRMETGGRFQIDSTSYFKGYVHITRRGPNFIGGNFQHNQGGGIMLDRNTRFYMGPQPSQESYGPHNWPRAMFRVDSLAAFDRTLWCNHNFYVDRLAFARRLFVLTEDARKYGGSSWINISDARVKTGIEPYHRGLPDILKLNPVWFQYNGRGGSPKDGKSYVGLMAQEVHPVMPEMVGSVDSLGPTEFLDDYPEHIPDDYADHKRAGGYLTIDNSALIYAVVNALKELNTRVGALEAK